MARIQITHSIDGRCLERIVQDQYNELGQTVVVPLTNWRPCNEKGKYWGRVGADTQPLPIAQRLQSVKEIESMPSELKMAALVLGAYLIYKYFIK